MYPSKTALTPFFENILLLDSSDVGDAQKTYKWCKWDAENEFFATKLTAENAKIWIFLKNVKGKSIYLLNSLDYALSHASRKVFTGNLAQSVQELWTVINSRVKNVARSGLKV